MAADLSPAEQELYDSAKHTAQGAAGGATATVEGIVLPTQAAGGELVHLPADMADLVALFAEEEPSPREVMGWILKQEDMPESDPEDGARAIVARILGAETMEDVLTISKVVHAQEILQVPLEIIRVKWQRSTVSEGVTCYAVITAVRLDDDEKITVTCGGTNVMTQLVKMGILRAYPFRGRIAASSKPTGRGYFPLWLEPA